ncbi:MAG: 30S ribosomal protein S8e [Nanobdellota archaeon]
MAISQQRSKRKPTSGRYNSGCKKKLHELGGIPTLTKLGESRGKNVKGRGSTHKGKLLTADTANVLDPKSKKYSKVKITSIEETPANRNYARRNLMPKGTVVETEKGKAKITSRPGQDGQINAVLI